MQFSKIITTIDIWTEKIRTLIWGFLEENSSFVVLWMWEKQTNAIRKWNILDFEAFKKDLDDSLLEAEKMSWEQISWAYVSFNSSSIEVIINKWIIAVSWDEIMQSDIDRVLEMAKSWVDMPNKTILKVIPQNFVVDLEENVKNPIWMSARKLEVLAHIFTINSSVLNNIKKALAEVGVEVLDIYPNLLTVWEAILTNRQKELWVAIVDIWASVTWITVYEEGQLIHSAIIPIWWDNVTNDIAIWARVSIELAEKLKKEYSIISSQEIQVKSKNIKLSSLDKNESWEIDLEYLSQITTARYEEILEFINKELKSIWKEAMLPEWVIFVGWASKEKWLVELSKDILKLPSFVGVPKINDELVDKSISDPSFAWLVGNMILAEKYWEYIHSFKIDFSSIIESIKKLINKLKPSK